MPIIRFTENDKQLLSLAKLGPAHPGEIVVHIEEAEDCEGLACGERLEMALPPEEYAKWVDSHAEKPALEKHFHLVVQGQSPLTLPAITFESGPLPSC
jgi:hypothetical protein